MQIPHGHVPPPFETDAMQRLAKVWSDLIATQNYPHGEDLYPTAYQEAAVQRFFPGTSARLLFLGCGAGMEVAAARRLGHEVWGVTLNPNNEKFAREQLGLTTVRYGDMHFLPTDWAGSFDGVLAFQTLEHTPSPMILLIEVLRVLRQGGLCYMETPGPDGWTLGPELHHITCPTPIQAQGWFQKAGFVSTQTEELWSSDSGRYLAAWGRKP